MQLDKDSVDKMSIEELEDALDFLKNSKLYPQLGATIAYVLTHHFYYLENYDGARKFFDCLIAYLEDPPGYNWCIVSVPMLAGVPLPHYLHKGYVMERAFTRLAREQKKEGARDA